MSASASNNDKAQKKDLAAQAAALTKPKATYIPVAALKRFATELETDAESNRFLQVNRERVSDFVEQPPAHYGKLGGSPRTGKYIKNTQVPGIYDYSPTKEAKSIIPLQNVPSFKDSLGPRSRFGEGDGSFFDKWLNSDVAKTKTLYDKDGFPIMKFSLGNIDTGFKRQLADYRASESLEFDSKLRNGKRFLQSYSERRAERLKKEKEITSDGASTNEETENMPTASKPTSAATAPPASAGTGLPSVPGTPAAAAATIERTASSRLDGYASIDVPIVETDDFKLPSITKLNNLSAAVKQNYFGEDARDNFFEYYRHLARQRFAVGELPGDGNTEGAIGAMNTARSADDAEFQIDDELYFAQETNRSHSALGTARSRISSRTGTRTGGGNRKEGVLEFGDNDDPAFAAPSTGRESFYGDDDYNNDNNNEGGIDDQQSAAHTARSVVTEDDDGARAAVTYSRMRRRVARGTAEGADSAEEIDERRLLMTHLEDHQQLIEENIAAGVSGDRPLSARSKFILGCVNHGVIPQPSLIIRKTLSTTLNIASMGIGNELAGLLADCLPTLPALEGLTIADNNLTDPGLTPIVKSLSRCRNLRYLDMSHNKVDAETAEALRKYLISDGCTIVHLVMKNANVDDFEASRFMKAIARRQTVIEIDLSQNLLGSHEFSVRTHDTAGVSIGELLQDPRCSLEKLIVAWNMIRFHSGVALCKSLKLAQSLTYLDISYNGLAVDGGEMLGDALHSNKSLRVVKLAHNNITARPCCTILSGVLTCKSIVELDLSENPIGEEGARALLSVNLHHGQRVAIDIHGCSLRVRDKSCWFNATMIEDSYSLDLSLPYERCVCIELIRKLAHSAEISIDRFEYTPPGETMRELPLDIYTSELPDMKNELKRQKSGLKRQKTGIADIANDIDQAREMFRRAADRIFKQYDMDDSGGLDRDEIAVLLSQLGLEGSMSIVDKLMTIYDTDGSGLIEEEEFISFLMDIKATQDQRDMWSSTDRYIYLKGGPIDSKTKEPEWYLPPDCGRMNIKLEIERAATGPSQVISQESVESMLHNTKNVTDSSALFEYALTVMKLNFGEAQTFFKVMVKEIGSVLQVMMKLLPRMATPADARMLISYVTANDFEQQHHLRTAVGSVYRVYLGLPNGFYRLNLSEASDKECLQRLLEINYKCASNRRRIDAGDTSQDGNNWYGFRNAVLDGQPFVVTKQWLERIPDMGRFEFDFVATETVPINETEISNLKLFRLLVSLGLVTEDKRKRIFSRLKLDKDDGRQAAKGNGTKRFEFGAHAMEEAYEHSVELYSSFHKNRPARVEMDITPEELAYLHPNSQFQTAPGTAQQQRSSANNTGTATPTPAAVAATTKPDTSAEPTDTLNGDNGANTSNEGVSVTAAADGAVNRTESTLKRGSFLGNMPSIAIDAADASANASFVKEMMQDVHIDEALVATRILEILENSLAGRCLSCVQLALILDRFPNGSYPTNNFYTFRVELVVTFFSKLVDIINFDFVLKELTAQEFAMVYFRLGWLNIWNPLKAEGFWVLDLSRREERQMVRVLMLLNCTETGETWQEQGFCETSVPNAPKIEGWKLEAAWLSEAQLPSQGVVSMHYFSGKGKGLKECAPDPRCRHVLMSLVLSQPFTEDVWSEEKSTMENAEALLATVTEDLSFRSERQEELRELGAKSTARSAISAATRSPRPS